MNVRAFSEINFCSFLPLPKKKKKRFGGKEKIYEFYGVNLMGVLCIYVYIYICFFFSMYVYFIAARVQVAVKAEKKKKELRIKKKKQTNRSLTS